MGLTDADGLSIAVDATSASEVTLVDDALDACFITELPERLVGDKAYDSDKLDKRLAKERNVEMIAPDKSNRRKQPTHDDGRVLRRYERRWKVERLFAWLGNFRRLVVRYEHHLENFLGMI